MTSDHRILEQLTARGITMPAPQTVYVADNVDLDHISDSVTIHPGCRLRGESLVIGPGCELGSEGPVTLDNCQLEGDVRLGGGYFCNTTARHGVRFGANAHVRPGTLLEESVTCGHAVGLKQTILLPYVTTGSLINFCDCLMAGGTGRADHSEIGSSYVHFNFRPQRDKATPSLLGDVPRGVMLDQPPIFLGGQGGLVGPARIEYGTVIAAGVICRHDALEAGHLLVGGAHAARTIPYQAGIYGDISRLLSNNLIYIGNLQALLHWYQDARVLFARDRWQQACQFGAVNRLREAITERIEQLGRMRDNLQDSLRLAQARHGTDLPAAPFALHQGFVDRWPTLRDELATDKGACQCQAERDRILGELSRLSDGNSYMEALQALSPDGRQAGTLWLQKIVDCYVDTWTRA